MGEQNNLKIAENTISVVSLTRATLASSSQQKDRLRREGTPEIIWKIK
jgi:hypothetical protein